MIAG
jgi:hypothetical protein